MTFIPLEFNERLQLAKSKLSAADKKIAVYIIKNKNGITHERLKSVAAALNISQATITRFAQKLGYSGFVELKHSFMNPALQDDTQFSKSDDVYLRKQYQSVLHDYTNLLSAFISTCDFTAIQKVASLMHQANRILLLGLGNSGFVVEELHAKFFYLGMNTATVKDAHDIRITARHSKKNDLAIFFSRSGTTHCIVDALQMARKNETPTVLITTNLNPVVHASADYCFTLPDRNLFMTQKILSNELPQLFIADILYSELFKLDKIAYAKKQNETQKLNY